MSATAVLYIVYAVVLIAGGTLGYVKSQSVPSLVSGLISGIVMIFAGVLAHHHPRVGLGLGALVGIALSIVFAQRYRKTGKAMPAIPIIALSIVVLIYSLARLVPALAHPA